MESLSLELARRLETLGLCTPRDLRRCRAQVRRLSRDLPAFDSVWIDALQQNRKLTPLQAKLLTRGPVEDLTAGPFVVESRFSSDGRLTTYRAIQRPEGNKVLLTLLSCRPEEQVEVLERLREEIRVFGRVWHPHLNLPAAANTDRDRIVIVAADVSGPTLGELVVRRGRFPATVVIEIARQLASGFAVLEAAGGLHGDVRLRNVRLAPQGKVMLLQAGIVAALNPLVTIHADIPADCYDGVAPELIGAHAERSASSDIYALGCLLWELLAGRPPYLAADPLARLAAHQSRRIDDVRDWAPSTPEWLARLLRGMTARHPQDRPASFRELSEKLGAPSAAGRKLLRRFARSFESAAPRQAGTKRKEGIVTPNAAVAALVLLVAAVGSLSHAGARSELLRIAERTGWLWEANSSSSGSPSLAKVGVSEKGATKSNAWPTKSDTSWKTLPAPGPDGIVTLTDAGPYVAGRLVANGPLTVRGNGGRAVIVVADEPLQLSGTVVVLQNVSIGPDSTSTRTGPLLEVTAQDLGIVDCRIDAFTTQPAKHPQIEWRYLSAASATGARLAVQDSAFTGGVDLVACETAPRSIQVQNSLKAGAGCLVNVRGVSSSASTQISLKDATFRDVDGVISVPSAGPPQLSIVSERSVFAPRNGCGVVQFAGNDTPRGRSSLAAGVAITGSESLLRTGSPLIMLVDAIGHPQPLDDSQLRVEGLQYADVKFAGELSAGASASVLIAGRDVSQSGRPPGIDAARFADRVGAAYNSPPAGPTKGPVRQEASRSSDAILPAPAPTY